MRSYVSVVLGRGRCESWIDFLKESAYDTVKLKHVNRYEEIMYQNRERVARILSHEPADRVPYCAVTDPPIPRLVDEMGLDPGHRSFCLDGDFAFVLIEPAVDRSAFEPYFDQIPEDTEFTIWGVGRRRKQTDAGWHAGYRMFHPLEHIDSIEELRRYPFPDIASSGADRGLEQKVKELKGRGYTILGQMSQTILETAYEMRGMLKLMTDFYERPGYVELLFESIASRRRFQARRFAEAGVDILRIGDDIATQESLLVSPELYRQRIKPLHASIIAEARRVEPDIHVKYHSDGKLTALLPDLIEIGVTVINPVQPECMDLLEIKREYKRDLTLWGCMPVQSVFAHGSRADVIRHLHFLMDHIAKDGGLVVKFTNFLITEQSLSNLKTFFEIFYRIGKYA